jgi:hypothetical protein
MTKINISLSFLCRKDFENYQSLCFAEDMYSAPPNTACFKIVRNRDFSSHQLHTLLLVIRACSRSIRNSELLEYLKAIHCSYTSSHQCFQPWVFADKYTLHFSTFLYVSNMQSCCSLKSIVRTISKRATFLEHPHISSPAWSHPSLPWCSLQPANKKEKIGVKYFCWQLIAPILSNLYLSAKSSRCGQ